MSERGRGRQQYVPIQRVKVIEGGGRGLQAYLREGEWRQSPALAFLVVAAAPVGDPGAAYFVFSAIRFRDLARGAEGMLESASARTIEEVFGLAPGRAASVLPTGARADGPAVVASEGRPLGVWVEQAEVPPGQPGTPLERPIPRAAPAPAEAPPRRAPPAPMEPPPDGAAPADLEPPPRRGLRRGGESRVRRTLRRWLLGPRREAAEAPAPEEAAEAPARGGFEAVDWTLTPRRGAPEPGADVVTRTPHLEVRGDLPLEPGEEFAVEVYADTQAPRPGEESEPIVIQAAPSQEEFPLDVWLITSDELEVLDERVKMLVVRRSDAASERVAFRLRVHPRTPRGAVASITALFVYDGRPSGHVRRPVGIGVEAPAEPGEPQTLEIPPLEGDSDLREDLPSRTVEVPAGQPAVAIDATARPPDLSVEIVAHPDNDGRKFFARVTTPHLPAYRHAEPEPWNLPAVSDEVVMGYMAEFTATGLDPVQSRDTLVGAGKLLFEAAPEGFKNVLWELIDSGAPLRSIYIVSQEPYVPWELMVPSRVRPDGEIEERTPLGVEFAIGRWIRDDHLSPRQVVPLSEAYVVAPNSSPPLPHALPEAQMVLGLFAGQRIHPALYREIDRVLSQKGPSLLHFVCHGEAGGGAVQRIKLDPNEVLSSLALLGMRGAKQALRTAQPMVFLNACEIGRQAPSLVGVEGFARSFLRLGARCVIAPLWSVKDSVAHDVAKMFYARAKEQPGTPFAEILREVRSRAYGEEGGEDTYAAYCFYGDPLAAAPA